MSKRKICIITTLVMLILMLVIPMLRLFVSLSGQHLVMQKHIIILGVLSVVFASAGVVFLKSREVEESNGKLVSILLFFIFPVSIIHIIYWSVESRDIFVSLLSVGWAILSGLCMLCGCSIKGLKVTSFILSGLMAVPTAFFLFVLLVFSAISANTVVNTVVSPNGEYRAEVISSDQGALGGDTFVDVYSEKYIIEIRDTPERVYFDGWGAHEHMSIYWESDNVLIINGEDYEIIP